jgi:hypothetical protein
MMGFALLLSFLQLSRWGFPEMYVADSLWHTRARAGDHSGTSWHLVQLLREATSSDATDGRFFWQVVLPLGMSGPAMASGVIRTLVQFRSTDWMVLSGSKPLINVGYQWLGTGLFVFSLLRGTAIMRDLAGSAEAPSLFQPTFWFSILIVVLMIQTGLAWLLREESNSGTAEAKLADDTT